jgi:peptidoglycan/xylan/chitin deacetylase (PgdA/CDA1 family)
MGASKKVLERKPNPFFLLLARIGLAEFSRRLLTRGGRFALNFHGVSHHRYPDVPRDLQPYYSVAEFHQTLAWIAARFDFLTVDDFLYNSKPGVLLTFDDGHANNLVNILPVLGEFKAQGLFFITIQHVLNPRNWLDFTKNCAKQAWGSESAVSECFARDCYDGLSENQLTELTKSPLAIIGSHTLTHPSLPACSPDQMHAEIFESHRILREFSHQPVNCFAYPTGQYNRAVAEIVRDAGYKAAFAVDPLPVGLPGFEIPRIGLYDSSSDYLSLKLSGLHRRALRGPVL